MIHIYAPPAPTSQSRNLSPTRACHWSKPWPCSNTFGRSRCPTRGTGSSWTMNSRHSCFVTTRSPECGMSPLNLLLRTAVRDPRVPDARVVLGHAKICPGPVAHISAAEGHMLMPDLPGAPFLCPRAISYSLTRDQGTGNPQPRLVSTSANRYSA